MENDHQMVCMSGYQKMQPNLRAQPFVIDPSETKEVDALVVTHIHSDHLNIRTAAIAHQSYPKALFTGPREVVETQQRQGIPSEEARVIEPGQKMKVNDVNVLALKAFDRTVLITSDDPENAFKGKIPQDINELTVNYLFRTSGGTVHRAGDSHHSNLLAKHGSQYAASIRLGAYSENPRSITDRITPTDMLRTTESLNTKVVTPVYYDIWSNFMADPREAMGIWKFKKNRLHYQFKPYI